MNLDHLKRLGLSATIGLLVGICAVVYIGPETTSGAALLIGLCVLASAIVGQVISLLGRLLRPSAKRRHRAPSHANPNAASVRHGAEAQPPESAQKARAADRRNAPAKTNLGHPRRT